MQISSLDYEVLEDILSTGNYIDKKQIVIGKMKDIFSIVYMKDQTKIIIC